MIPRVKLDAIVRRLQHVHEMLGSVPLTGLELKCENCGASITSDASRAVLGAVLELEDAIESLIDQRHAAHPIQRSA